MAFIKLEPVAPIKIIKNKISMVKARRGKDTKKDAPDQYVLNVSFAPSDFDKRMGTTCDRVDAYFGDGDDKGQLRLQENKAGVIAVCRMKYVTYIRFPVLDNMPNEFHEQLGYEVESVTLDDNPSAKVICIALPDWASKSEAELKEVSVALATANIQSERDKDEALLKFMEQFKNAPPGTFKIVEVLTKHYTSPNTGPRISKKVISITSGLSQPAIINAVAWLVTHQLPPVVDDCYTIPAEWRKHF